MSRPLHVVSTLLFVLSTGALSAQAEFDVPVRINMGGPEVVDAAGNTWLGDGGGPGDALNIRPDDAGGTNTIPGWCTPTPFSIENVGFAADDPVAQCFQSIRWDNGADASNYVIELGIPNGQYVVNMYFCEACCDNRHFQIEIQGEVLEEDVHRAYYADAFHDVGKLEFEGITVDDGVLRIALLPCPQCPPLDGAPANDINAILSAFEVLPDAPCEPADAPLGFSCSYDAGTNRVTGNWEALPGAETYRILRDDVVLIPELPAAITSFVDADPPAGGAGATYTLEALDGDAVMASCRCTISTRACPGRLVCDADAETGEVSLSWNGAVGVDVVSYDIVANGVNIGNIGGDETTFVDTPADRTITYQVIPVTDPPGECRTLSCTVENQSILFETPFRVNAGGPEITDSFGRVWLGDQGLALDPLSIRPDDNGGLNVIEAWCNPSPDTVSAWGFDPAFPSDVDLFRSIRWDPGADASNFDIVIPIANGDYDITLYFCEACCPHRHFKIALQGEVVVEDVSQAAYANGPHEVGRYEFKNIPVDDRLLRISLLPCPECECPECVPPTVIDINAILTAFEVVESGGDPCAEEGFRLCTSEFAIEIDDGGEVVGAWDPPLCVDPVGYQILKNGELLHELDANTLTFSDTLTERVGVYELVTLLPEGDDPCPVGIASVLRDEIPFEVPLRINMGGPAATDSLGRLWLGDPGRGVVALGIRPDDIGGINVLSAAQWCGANAVSQRDSMASLGLDPSDAADLSIFHSIRYDTGDDDGDGLAGATDDPDGGDIDFHMEIPVPNGEYSLGMYFTECCCARHINIYVQGELVLADAHPQLWSPSGRFARVGYQVFDEVVVEDGLLRIHLEPCQFCPGGGDLNPLISALEVLPIDESSSRCPHDLTCSISFDGIVTGSWAAPQFLDIESYDLVRDGEVIDSLPGDATEFTDEPDCRRVSIYEIVPVSADPEFSCEGLNLTCSVVVDITCPFIGDTRINMGGPTATDSQGRIWIGDEGAALDPLDIRVDDVGGTNAVINWAIGGLRPESLADVDLDPASPADHSLISTIRWDPADGINWEMEIPVEDGVYTVEMWFCENFHNPPTVRQFGLMIEGNSISPKFSTTDYSPDNPVTGWAGLVTFEDVEVEDGALSISFPECDPVKDCPDATDRNAILNLLRFFPEDDGGGNDDPKFVRGDSNSSGTIDLTDGIRTLNFLFTGGPEPTCLDAADSSDDGVLGINDAIQVFSYLFTGGGAPKDPGPTTAVYPATDCGVDPTDDDLGCAVMSTTCQ